MKLIRTAFFVTALTALNAFAQPASQPPQGTRVPPNVGGPRMPPSMMPSGPATMPDKDKLSAAIGFFFGNQIKHDHLDLDMDAVVKNMKDVLAGRPTAMNEIEAQEILRQLQRALPAKLAAENKAKGEEFLAKNGKAPGVTILPNGIQYKALKEGSGAMPKTNETVIVSYKGMLIDGTVFDQNEHFTTPVTGRTIKGWSEILPLMKTGDKWEVAIPSDLAYGMRAPPKIGPNAVLVFDMELLSISEPPAAPKPAPAPALPPHAALVNPPPSTPGGPPTPPGTTTPVVSGQIIKVPSAEELKKGAKIEVITNVPNQ